MFTGLMEEPYELNWVQSFTFLDKDKAKDLFTTQRRRLVSAGDAAVSQVAALEEAMDQLISNRFVVGDHNAALIVYGEDLDALARNVAFGHATLADPGQRRRARGHALEGQVYATLPGNAKYRPRKAPITSLNFAAMSPFYAFPAGDPGRPPLGRGGDTVPVHGGHPAVVLAPRRGPGAYQRHRHVRRW
jgi:type IV secretion system protein VirB4